MRYGVLILAALLSAGCGNKVRERYSATEEPVSQSLHFTISSPSGLPDAKRDIYSAVYDKRPVLFGDVTYALVEDQYLNWRARQPEEGEFPTLEDFSDRLSALAAKVPAANLAEIKDTLEKNVSAAPLIYNARAISVADIVFNNRTQAFSGTQLQQIVLRQALGQKKFAERHFVLIYESGHVLPGWVQMLDGQWHLFGTETTVEGPAKVVYGPLAKADAVRMLRVVDAELAAMVDLFKFDADDVMAMTNEALRLTAEMYGIKSPPYLVKETFYREVDANRITWSPFQFGRPDAGKTDMVREKFVEKKREELPRLNPNITVLFNGEEPAPATTPVAPQSGIEPDPPYPYRQIEVPKSDHPEGIAFQCWNYKLRKWITMSHIKDGDLYRIRRNPCKESLRNYPELPLPLAFYGDDSGPEDDDDY